MKRKDRRKYLLLFMSFFFVFISIPRMKSLVSHTRKLQYYNAEIKRLKEENEVLATKIKAMKEDPYYAEKMLRENHGYIREGEHVYRINEEKGQ